MKAFTAFRSGAKPRGKRRGKAASTPRGMSSLRVKWLSRDGGAGMHWPTKNDGYRP